MRREVVVPGANRGGGASNAAVLRVAARTGCNSSGCGVATTACGDSSALEKSAAGVVEFCGRAWQQEPCAFMADAVHSLAMLRQQACRAEAWLKRQAKAGAAVQKTTAANNNTAPFLLQSIAENRDLYCRACAGSRWAAVI